MLKDFLHPVNKQPVYITETLTQRDSELLDYSRGLGMYTVTYNCAPPVFVSKADSSFQRHKLVDMKDAEQIFKNKSPMMTRQAYKVRNQNLRVVQNNQNNFSRPPNVSVRKRDREISPNNVERNQLINELYSRLSDPVKLVQFVESFQEILHSPNSSTTEIIHMKMILISSKSISTLFTVFCRKSHLFFFRKHLLRDMTELTTTQTAFFLNVQPIRAHHDYLAILIESFDKMGALHFSLKMALTKIILNYQSVWSTSLSNCVLSITLH